MKKILLAGDSLIEFYDWQRRFPEYAIENKGLAGETVKGLLLGLPRILSQVDSPDAVVLMIGTNNLAMDDYYFMGDYQAILEKLQNRYSYSRIAVTSLLPLYLPWLAPDAVDRLNTSLRNLAGSLEVDFLDVCSRFRAEGSAERNLFLEDGVHLSNAGYTVWSGVLQGYFADIFQ